MDMNNVNIEEIVKQVLSGMTDNLNQNCEITAVYGEAFSQPVHGFKQIRNFSCCKTKNQKTRHHGHKCSKFRSGFF